MAASYHKVISLDMDGCLFHRAYSQRQDGDVVSHNEAFLAQLREGIEPAVNSIKLMLGSNRQSKKFDADNFLKASSGSGFVAITELADALGVTLDPFLMADIYGNLDDGKAFEQALPAAQTGYLTGHEQEHADWQFDRTKITLLYAQIHRAAFFMPADGMLSFDFYDNDQVILKSLKTFFEQYPQLLPSCATLNLHHYAGAEITVAAVLQGEGPIDEDYRQTAKDMIAIASKRMAKYQGVHNVVTPEKLSQVKEQRAKGAQVEVLAPTVEVMPSRPCVVLCSPEVLRAKRARKRQQKLEQVNVGRLTLGFASPANNVAEQAGQSSDLDDGGSSPRPDCF